jgi:hypothetical protein
VPYAYCTPLGHIGNPARVATLPKWVHLMLHERTLVRLVATWLDNNYEGGLTETARKIDVLQSAYLTSYLIGCQDDG